MARLAFGMAWGLGLAGCNEPTRAYPFEAFPYRVAQDCLESRILVALAGHPLATCEEVRCWEGQTDEWFVTDTLCSAPAGYTDRTAAAPEACVAALEAYARGDAGRCTD